MKKITLWLLCSLAWTCQLSCPRSAGTSQSLKPEPCAIDAPLLETPHEAWLEATNRCIEVWIDEHMKAIGALEHLNRHSFLHNNGSMTFHGFKNGAAIITTLDKVIEIRNNICKKRADGTFENIPCHTKIISMLYDESSATVICIDADSIFYIHHLHTDEHGSFDKHQGQALYCVAISEGGDFFAYAIDHLNIIYVFDLKTRRCRTRILLNKQKRLVEFDWDKASDSTAVLKIDIEDRTDTGKKSTIFYLPSQDKLLHECP